MTDKAVIKQPFTWEAFQKLADENPDLDILSAFSFEHLYGDEIQEVVRGAYELSLLCKARLARTLRLLEHLTRLQLREHKPKADVVEFPGRNGETLQ